MKKTIIVTLVIVLGLIGLIWFGSKSQTSTSPTVPQTGAKTALFADETMYDFGTISMKKGDATKDFIITNPTNNDMEISSISTSCMCTNALIVRADGTTKGPFGMAGHGYLPPANEIIKAGENIIIRAIYNPNAHGPAGVGFIDRFITLVDKTGNSLSLEVKATVTP